MILLHILSLIRLEWRGLTRSLIIFNWVQRLKLTVSFDTRGRFLGLCKHRLLRFLLIKRLPPWNIAAHELRGLLLDLSSEQFVVVHLNLLNMMMRTNRGRIRPRHDGVVDLTSWCGINFAISASDLWTNFWRLSRVDHIWGQVCPCLRSVHSLGFVKIIAHEISIIKWELLKLAGTTGSDGEHVAVRVLLKLVLWNSTDDIEIDRVLLIVDNAVLRLLRSIGSKGLSDNMILLHTFSVSWWALHVRSILFWGIKLIRLVHMANWILLHTSKEKVLLILHRSLIVAWWKNEIGSACCLLTRSLLVHGLRLMPLTDRFWGGGAHNVYIRLRTLDAKIQKFSIRFRFLSSWSATLDKYLLGLVTRDIPWILQLPRLELSSWFNSLILCLINLSLIEHRNHTFIFFPFSSKIVYESLSLVKSRLHILMLL